MFTELLSANIKRLRESRNMTQAELESACGLAHMTISHFECGRRTPSAHNIVKLCEGLGCTPDELYRCEQLP